jgi:hypothetical protein
MSGNGREYILQQVAQVLFGHTRSATPRSDQRCVQSHDALPRQGIVSLCAGQ